MRGHTRGVVDDQRVLAPDLARGAMLLLIALANVPWYLWGARPGPTGAHPLDGSMLDHLVQVVTIVAIDGRVYPMFTFLLGYGMVQFATARSAQGATDAQVRRWLLRRHLALVLIGAVHAGLLFVGDVLGAYGLLGLVLVPLLFSRRTRTVVIWGGILAGLTLTFLLATSVLLYLLETASPGAADLNAGSFGAIGSIMAETDYVASVGERLRMWLVMAPSQAFLGSALPFILLLGWVVARRRVLEEPGAHLPLLRRTAVVGIALGVLGGLPSAAMHIGLIDAPAWIVAALTLDQLTGVAAGLGYIAAFTLLARALSRRGEGGRLRYVLVSVGRLSLTCYLIQSLVFAPLLSGWGLGLGDSWGSAAAATLAVLAWALSAAVAVACRKAGVRGPAETVLRVLTSGRRSP